MMQKSRHFNRSCKKNSLSKFTDLLVRKFKAHLHQIPTQISSKIKRALFTKTLFEAQTLHATTYNNWTNWTMLGGFYVRFLRAYVKKHWPNPVQISGNFVCTNFVYTNVPTIFNCAFLFILVFVTFCWDLGRYLV